MGRPLLHSEDSVTSCIWIGSIPGLADPSYLPHQQAEMLYLLGGILREVESPPPILVGDTLEYEVEGVLQHQGTGT